MQVQELARMFAEANLKQLKHITTIQRDDPPVTRSKNSVAYGIDRHVKGVYFFYQKGHNVSSDPMNPLYVGETISSIQSRLRNHKRSLRDPNWTVECTGKKFIKAGIDLDTEFDVHYIDSDVLGINTRKESLLAEAAFMVHLRPLVWK